jgi:hypothetical protein
MDCAMHRRLIEALKSEIQTEGNSTCYVSTFSAASYS